MKRFLSEYWRWIVLSLVVAAALIGYLASTSGGDGEFHYRMF